MNPVVIDTNIALDLLLFGEPASVPLAEALAAGELRWLVATPMREEIERVLGYPVLAAQLAQRAMEAPALLARFDAMALAVETPPRASCRCTDPDDQMFIDLAVAHRALLLSKDRAVLKMKKALSARGVPVLRLFSRPTPDEAQ